MFSEPVANLNVVSALVAGIPEGSGLFGGKVPSLSFGDPIQFLLWIV
jgi:hypothetical protein